LLDALNQAQLLVPMVILIAQQREFCVEKVDRSEEHLKHISNLYDDVSDVAFYLGQLILCFTVSSHLVSICRILDHCTRIKLLLDIAPIGRTLRKDVYQARSRISFIPPCITRRRNGLSRQSLTMTLFLTTATTFH
jgi:hypothetical protein